MQAQSAAHLLASAACAVAAHGADSKLITQSAIEGCHNTRP